MDGFQPARRIVDVLADIEHQQLVLPAIQREFVWSEAKVCALFDSLMRGYPIGGFLFWRVSDETVGSHAFYGFIRDYDVRPPNNFCPKLEAISLQRRSRGTPNASSSGSRQPNSLEARVEVGPLQLRIDELEQAPDIAPTPPGGYERDGLAGLVQVEGLAGADE